MKQLLLLLLFFGSLDCFSQLPKLKEIYCTPNVGPFTGELMPTDQGIEKPDTLRATLIVYHDGDHSFLHTMPGFVVRALRTTIGSERYFDETFLDDRKRVIKAPLIVFGYKLR